MLVALGIVFAVVASAAALTLIVVTVFLAIDHKKIK
jgi:hypothetical protein